MITDSDYIALRELRLEILRMAHLAGEGHVPSSLSILEAVYLIHRDYAVLPSGLDRFVLSKGHGCLALYATLARIGQLETKDLDSLGKSGSKLGGHPDYLKVPGVSASTGSLGHGFAIAVGIAYEKKFLRNHNGGRVFSIVGDGECNEGSIWEAALLASHHNLNNLTVWVDFNHSGDRAISMSPMLEKWQAFGFEAIEVDGHHLEQIHKAITKTAKKPLAIIANSIKGYGVPFMENNPEWHHKNLDLDLYKKAVSEVR